ncbi:Aste57867_9484 [Aphanomyces stellatus]|uniref:Aste57867_9484 protein n=1 Tax=Aphanomyces stellatus TaxID=120398 RepID=A0A485KN03_9STRA|nr:hypothetical protein As57867_009447 [Aphanomyces stellatus]VFT86363.1 Aste57867_9484 [Aphanomyces stellatus]
MSGNPIRDFTVDLYSSLGHTKDAFAWIQGLVIMTLGIRIGFTIVVALNISFVSFVEGRGLWLPDVFPTIKRHIQVRSVLLLLAICADQFWAVQEWVLTKTLVRYNLLPMFVLGNGIRSDFLVLFLIWTDAIASLLQVGITPVIPVLTYVLCFTHSDKLVLGLTSADMEARVQAYQNAFYIRNLISFSPTSMNLWTRFQLTPSDPPTWLVARELSWFFAPCIGITIVLVLYKLVLLVRDFVQPPLATFATLDAVQFSAPASAMRGIDQVPMGFLDHFLPGSDDGLPTRGLVTHAPPAFHFTADAFEVHKSILWNAGWVLVGGRFLVLADDLPNIILNVVTRATWTKIYCCFVHEVSGGRGILVPNLETLPTWDLPVRALVHLQLETLWVRHATDAEREAHRQRSLGLSTALSKVAPTTTGPMVADVGKASKQGTK